MSCQPGDWMQMANDICGIIGSTEKPVQEKDEMSVCVCGGEAKGQTNRVYCVCGTK